jgi:hypothetical protein
MKTPLILALSFIGTTAFAHGFDARRANRESFEARERTEHAERAAAEQALDHKVNGILHKIEHASREGKLEIDVDGRLDHQVVQALQNKGFRVLNAAPLGVIPTRIDWYYTK